MAKSTAKPTTTATPAPETAPETPLPPPEPYPVLAARTAFALLDERERFARSDNCLTAGHPLAEAIATPLGRFCPHCCAYIDDSGA